MQAAPHRFSIAAHPLVKSCIVSIGLHEPNPTCTFWHKAQRQNQSHGGADSQVDGTFPCNMYTADMKHAGQ